MDLTVLLISAYLPLPILMFMILRSGAFGKGSIGTMFRLFFLGVAAAVPAFLMEAACLLVIKILMGLFPDDAFGGHLLLVRAIVRYFIAVALNRFPEERSCFIAGGIRAMAAKRLPRHCRIPATWHLPILH